jgi:hypothetical protein
MSESIVVVGKAILQDGLRCAGTRNRGRYPSTVCNKLQVKPNRMGQISGSYKCERCGQEIEVLWQS